MKNKFVSLNDLVSLVPDGATLAMGGSLLHRGPFAFSRELVRKGRKDLVFIKPSAGYDLDLLCASKSIKEVHAGIVTMEAGYGLAQNYRFAVQKGEIHLYEHA
jgi:glutaconate CoA-transferase subunit A